MERVTAARVAAAALAASVVLGSGGCGVGRDAVDQSAGGDRRFVAGQPGPPVALAPRLPAPRIRGEAVRGPAVDSDDYRGKVLVVNFWGSWCAPCRTEAETLEEISRVTRADGVQFLGVNIKDTQTGAAAFERAYGVTYPSVYDQAGRVALQFRRTPPVSTPATMLVDRAGRVATIFRRPVTYTELAAAVAELAAERG